MKLFIMFCKDILNKERDVVYSYRLKGIMFPKLSSLLLCLLFILYTIATWDIKLREIVKPLLFGWLDIIVCLVVLTLYVYIDVTDYKPKIINEEEIEIKSINKLEEKINETNITEQVQPLSGSNSYDVE